MKTKILYLLVLLSASAFTFWSASSGPAAVQGADRTGSPLSVGTCALSSCHNSGAFSPSLNVQLLDGETPVSTYEPGNTYTLRVAITGASSASRFGFQAVMLQGENNANAGTFGTPTSGIQVTTLNNVMYAEHSSASTGNVFSIAWTAPAGGAGDIRIYAAGNAANGNGFNSGDQGVSLAEPLVISEAATSNSREQELTFAALQVSPNPTRSDVWVALDNREPGRYTIELFDAMGRRLQQEAVNLVTGSQTYQLDLHEHSRGLYFLKISNGQRLLTRKILKQ